MAPSQQDAFMDDSDDCCPLCVEELDVQDKEFHPCECGYQICQFCFNNIRSNMNGLCPACRRPYVDEKIKWKVFSPEELKADVVAAAKRKAAARQKEAERRQAETVNRKHLSGLRVVQKNLVYVVGMNLTGVDHSDILSTLRGPHHFGQYGDIIKIVVSKAKNEGQPLGIYVTFARKEDAARCIAALDSQPHDGRTLRAQYGTTKYCSAYIRGERCNNRHCMFLHETGEDSDSFDREDLSSYNALGTQRKNDLSQQSSQQSSQPRAPPQQAPQSIAAATQPSEIGTAKGDAMSRSDSGEGSALPTTANWAKNPQVEQSRRSSQAASRATPSPKTSNVKPVISRPQSRLAQSGQAPVESKGKAKEEMTKTEEVEKKREEEEDVKPSAKPEGLLRWERALKLVSQSSFAWRLDRSMYDADTLALIDNMPPLVDPNGGAIRLALKLREERDRAKQEEEVKSQALAVVDDEENLASGSLQLGGEPETNEQPGNGRRQQTLQASGTQAFEGNVPSIGSDFAGLSLSGRSLTPQQQRNAAITRSGNGSDAFPSQVRAGGSQHQPQLSNPFQTQNQQLNNMARHVRQTSRYSFANDNPAVSTAKPSNNPQLLAQQSSMMQGGQQKPFTSQPPVQSSIYSNNYSNIQGPPPGLKSSGTPPISGGGMFGQGHGFASAMGGSLNYGGNTLGMKGNTGNDELVRDIIRGRGIGGAEASKLDIADPSIVQARMHHGGIGQGSFNSTQGQDPFLDSLVLPQPPPGFGMAPGLHRNVAIGNASNSRPETPAVPPGLALPSDFPPLSAPSKTSSGETPTKLEQSVIGEPRRISKPVVPAVPQPPQRSPTLWQRQQTDPKSSTVFADAPDKPLASTKEDEQGDLLSQAGELLSQADDSKDPEIKLEKGKRKIKDQLASAVMAGKRPKPENLDIVAAKHAAKEQFEAMASPADIPKPETPKQSASGVLAAGSSQPQTPATATSQTSSPVVKTARTLRLIPTPKVDGPSGPSVTGSTSQNAITKSASRQASVASFNQSEIAAIDSTPDNVSSTSASLSRPTSPNASGKTGAVPTRQKTKSQAKKDRQARAKVDEGKIFDKQPSALFMDEPVQAPIIGRKKKLKKQTNQESTQKNTQPTTPASPDGQKDSTSPVKPEPEPVVEKVEKPLAIIEETAATHSDSNTPVLTQSPKVEITQDDHPPKALTPAAILADLKAGGDVDSADLDLITDIPTFTHRLDTGNFGVTEHKLLPALSHEQMDTLEDGDPVIVEISSQECAIVLPDHSVLRHLSHSEAERYVRLRKSVAWGDTEFLASSRLPFCMSMKDTWDEYSAYGLSISGQDLMYSAESEELSRYYASSVLRINDAVTLDDGWQHRGEIGNEDLASSIETMNFQEAQLALKKSEEHVVGMAKKEADAMEKKLNQTLKKNKKVFREALGAY